MTATIDAYLAAAISEIGYKEQPAGSNRTKFAAEARHANGLPWCMTFQVAIASRVGLILPSVSAYTPTVAKAFKSAGRWVSTPERGDLVFYDFPDNSHRIQHVGVVDVVRPDGKIEAIEGNTSIGNQSDGGQVMRRVRTQASVVGYGRPAYVAAPPAPPHPPSGGSPQLLEESIMAVFKDDGDREVWFVRDCYLRHLGREPESEGVVFMWIDIMREHGGDAVTAGIADSDEGQAYRAAVDKHLGIVRT